MSIDHDGRGSGRLLWAPSDIEPAQRDAILEERAVELASRGQRARARTVWGQAVIVRRGDAQLALPTRHIVDVRWADVVRLPHGSRFVQGLVRLRDQVVAVVDLAAFFGAAEPVGHGQKALLAVLEFDGRSLGLRIDEAVESTELFVDELTELDASGLAFVKRVTRSGVQVIEVGALFDMPELTVTGAGKRPLGGT